MKNARGYRIIGGDEWLGIRATHKKIIEKDCEHYIDNWSEVKNFMPQFGVDHNMDFLLLWIK